jgi:hypothetical protein
MEIKTPVSAALSPEQISAIGNRQSPKAVKGAARPACRSGHLRQLAAPGSPQDDSEGMDIPYPYLYGVMSFYTMFSPTPRGKFIIRLCESPPCHIMGAENLLEVLKTSGIKAGNHQRRSFTLEHTACLGSANGPRPEKRGGTAA